MQNRIREKVKELEATLFSSQAEADMLRAENARLMSEVENINPEMKK